MKTQLTKEQSQHLIDLGVPKEKASELQEWEDDLSKWTHRGDPIFTLTDLLEMLPKEIELNDRPYFLHIQRMRFGIYSVKYKDYSGKYLGNNFIHNKELIDSLYEICVWCLKNKHLKF